jgi:hypothetical protein
LKYFFLFSFILFYAVKILFYLVLFLSSPTRSFFIIVDRKLRLRDTQTKKRQRRPPDLSATSLHTPPCMSQTFFVSFIYIPHTYYLHYLIRMQTRFSSTNFKSRVLKPCRDSIFLCNFLTDSVIFFILYECKLPRNWLG